MSRLPDFRLETYFSKWEFNTKYNPILRKYTLHKEIK